MIDILGWLGVESRAWRSDIASVIYKEASVVEMSRSDSCIVYSVSTAVKVEEMRI